MVYEWKAGSRMKANAEKVGAELESIKGVKTPTGVIEMARNAKTELHRCFTWDDSEAAEAYRLEEARAVLRSITVVRSVEVPNEEPKQVKVRAYEHVDTVDEKGQDVSGYAPIDMVLSNVALRAQVMQRLADTIEEAGNTARTYTYLERELLSDVADTMDMVKHKIRVAIPKTPPNIHSFTAVKRA